MPYVNRKDRHHILASGARTPGELNFEFTTVICDYMRNKGLNYQTINDISGAMTEALAEFRRRVVAGYEDSKITDNGDIPYYHTVAVSGRAIFTGPTKTEGTQNA